MQTDTGKRTATSTGSESTNPQTLASVSAKAGSPSTVAQMKPVSSNSLKTLADILSLLQEDLSQYQKTLAKHLQNGNQPVIMRFDRKKGGIIFLASPPGHTLDTGKGGHILLDDIPVTGWKPPDTGEP